MLTDFKIYKATVIRYCNNGNKIDQKTEGVVYKIDALIHMDNKDKKFREKRNN